jgi:sugar lactone lactonase YvrE
LVIIDREENVITCIVQHQNILGEGACWSHGDARLYWVDIKSRTIEWVDPSTGADGIYDLDHTVTAIATRLHGGLLLATAAGFATFDPASGQVDLAHHPEPDLPWNRSNDGHTDPTGRFWLGTMDDNETARSGAIYKLEPDWTCSRVKDGLGIPNTLACSPDGKTFYVAESKDQTLYAYELDLPSGALGRRRHFASVHGAGRTPDGSAVDAEGGLWNAEWGGGRVVRYAPDGTVDRTVPLPISQPTSCAFGGRNFSTLYVTSARIGLPPETLAREPLAGSVFSIETGIQGLALSPFGG